MHFQGNQQECNENIGFAIDMPLKCITIPLNSTGEGPALWTSFAPYLFQLGWLKLNQALLVDQLRLA